jgi:outer membrane protein TolC
MALEKQPALAAARASLAAAEARVRSLDRLCLASLLSRDIPIRRQQAALGVEIQQAALLQAEADTLHSVTYTYLAALFSLEMQEEAERTRIRLVDLKELAEKIVREGLRKDVSEVQVKLVDSYIRVVNGRLQEALLGHQRALAGLREAMGLEPDCPLQLAQNRLPEASFHPFTCSQVVDLALARRAEVVQTGNLGTVTCLEVQAQGKTLLPSSRTFAAGSDIHAKPVPTGVHDLDYKPDVLGEEMPTLLAGPRSGRVEQAQAYHARAEAVADKTRNLIALDAQNACLRWQEFAAKSVQMKDAPAGFDEHFRKLRQRFSESLDKAGSPTLEDLLDSGRTAARVRIEARQTEYQALLSLAALERITAGGLCIDFVWRSANEK